MSKQNPNQQEAKPKSYILPISGLSRAEIENYKKLSLWEGGFLSVYASIFNGFIIAGYFLQLGFSNFQMGLIWSLALLAQSIGPVGAWLAGLLGVRKFLAINSGLLAKVMMIVLPIIILAESVIFQASFLAIVLTIQAMLASINTVLWCSWTESIVPIKERPQFLTKRSIINSIISLVSVNLAAILLDSIPAPLNFQLVMWIAVAFGLLSVIPMLRQSEVKYPLVPKKTLRQTFNSAGLDLKLKPLLVFACVFYAGLYLSHNFLPVYFIQDLKMSYKFIAVWVTITGLATLYFASGWQRLADRYGTKLVLAFAVATSATIIPFLLIMARPGAPIIVWLAAFVEGLCASSINALILSALTKTKKGENENNQPISAYFWLIVGLCGAAAIFFAGTLIDIMLNVQLPRFLNYQVSPFHFVIALSAGIRLLSIVPLMAKTNKAERKVREMIYAFIPTLFGFDKR